MSIAQGQNRWFYGLLRYQFQFFNESFFCYSTDCGLHPRTAISVVHICYKHQEVMLEVFLCLRLLGTAPYLYIHTAMEANLSMYPNLDA